MEHFRKHFILVLILVISVLSFGMLACKDDVDGRFYSLEDSYKNELISHSDLVAIAELLNSGRNSDDELNSDIESAIKNKYAELHDLNVKNIMIEYYGSYNDCVAVICSVNGYGYTTEMVEVYIDDVRLIYNCGGIEMLVWKSI